MIVIKYDFRKMVGLRIRRSREGLEMTQRELAAKAGVPSGAVAHWEMGRRMPSCENLYRVSKALDLTSDYILGLK